MVKRLPEIDHLGGRAARRTRSVRIAGSRSVSSPVQAGSAPRHRRGRPSEAGPYAVRRQQPIRDPPSQRRRMHVRVLGRLGDAQQPAVSWLNGHDASSRSEFGGSGEATAATEWCPVEAKKLRAALPRTPTTRLTTGPHHSLVGRAVRSSAHIDARTRHIRTAKCVLAARLWTRMNMQPRRTFESRPKRDATARGAGGKRPGHRRAGRPDGSARRVVRSGPKGGRGAARRSGSTGELAAAAGGR